MVDSRKAATSWCSLKDGTNLNVPDSVRSFDPSVGSREGPHGKYNYEYKIGLDSIPGNNVAGNYTILCWTATANATVRDFNFTGSRWAR